MVAPEPLGLIEIPLDSVTSGDQWYKLEQKDLRMKIPPKGQICLSAQFSRPVDDDVEQGNDEEQELLVESEEEKQSAPNQLRVKVIKAKNLKKIDGALYGSHQPDPLVRCHIATAMNSKLQKETHFEENSVNPVWQEELVFDYVIDESTSLNIIVEDENGLASKRGKFGKVIIPINRFKDKKLYKNLVYDILNPNTALKDIDRGTIELEIKWCHDKEIAKKLDAKNNSRVNKVAAGVGRLFKGVAKATGLAEEELSSDDGEGDEVPDDEEDEAAKKAQEEAAEKAQKEVSDIEFVEGDYQIHIHLIEARDLNSENADGTSDPIVFVTAMGQKRHTHVVRGVISCVFDETFIFDFKNKTKDELEEAIIQIEVKNDNLLQKVTGAVTGGGQRLIGSTVHDLAGIYCANKNHELHRQWACLMNTEDKKKNGVQGFLKFSVQIIGPGEKVAQHNEEEDRAADQKREIEAGGDIGSLALSVPSLSKSWQYIVVSVLKCEGLPVMDGKTAMSSAKTDAYCQLQYAGGKPIRTKVVTIKGDSQLAINPLFNCELWYPVSVPVTTQVVKFSVWDRDIPVNELIANVVEKIPNFQGNTEQDRHKPKWYNLYGSPEYKVGISLVNNAQKAVAGVAKGISSATNKIGATSFIDYKKKYNAFPNEAPVYKGRALLSFRIEKALPPRKGGKKYKDETKPIKKSIKRMEYKEPKTTEYVLKAQLMLGTQLRPPLTNFTASEYKVKVSVGLNEALSKGARVDSTGLCKWGADEFKVTAILPDDLEQIPDIFVYLLQGDKPISFKRFTPYVRELTETEKVKDGKKEILSKLVTLGFQSNAEWVALEENKVSETLADSVSSSLSTSDGCKGGNLLMKIGFGKVEDEKDMLNQGFWKKSQEDTRVFECYDIRVNVYQGEHMKAVDIDNGLADPFIKASFNGKEIKTAVISDTLFPAWYETLVFKQVDVAEAENFLYNDLITCRILDKNKSGFNKYMGRVSLSLQKATIVSDPYAPAPIPTEKDWYEVYDEKPGDGEGRVLVTVLLIKNPTKVNWNKPPKSILPYTKKAIIEILAVGIRDLSPYQFQKMRAPFLEMVLESFYNPFEEKQSDRIEDDDNDDSKVDQLKEKKKTVKNSTAPSKRPSPDSPNFLEKIIMKVDLPENSIFAMPLLLEAKDTRLGGLRKPVVGIGSIDLKTKIPWCKETYIPPSKQSFYAESDFSLGDSTDDLALTGNKDKVARDVASVQKSRNLLQDEDDFIVNQAPPPLEEFVKSRKQGEDTGAGVFGALQHIRLNNENIKSKAELAFEEFNPQDVEEKEPPPKWSIGRQILNSTLEEVLQTTPFETYRLTRGRKSGIFGSTLKVVGKFKGIIRVVADTNSDTVALLAKPPIVAQEVLDEIFSPKKYKARLYVLEAKNLKEMDVDYMGMPKASDPYIRVSIGNFKFNDRENYVDSAIDVDLYKLVEFDVELPGISHLTIEMMDRDMFGAMSDDLIGKTIIDLEDRWFDDRWRKLGNENRTKALDGQGEDGKPVSRRWDTKPVENRELYLVPPEKRITSKQSTSLQGNLTCWLDIMTPEEASGFPPDDVALPPKQIFEVRVVIWKTKNVPPMDSLEGMSDLFVKCWPEGCKPQETDTHWRCKKGNASFNWRLLFDVELGHNTRAMKFPYLHLQLWDRDIIKWNDCAGEGTIDLGKYYKKAYKNNVAIKLFEKAKGAQAARQIRQKERPKPLAVVETGQDKVPDEEDEVDDVMKDKESETLEMGSNPIHHQADSDDDDDIEKVKELNLVSRKSKSAVAGGGQTVAKAEDKKSKEVKKPTSSWWPFGGKPKEKEDPLLVDGAPNIKDDDDDDEAEVQELVRTVKDMTGLWDEPPPDSDEYQISKHDHNQHKDIKMGSIFYSVQIWPKDKALAMPAGAARNEPNSNPFLPPPVGRMKWTLNPFVFGSQLCGPKLCAKFSCCILCLVFIILMIFCQPFLNIIINLIFVVFK